MTVISQIPSYSEHSKSKSIKLECEHAENCILTSILRALVVRAESK